VPERLKEHAERDRRYFKPLFSAADARLLGIAFGRRVAAPHNTDSAAGNRLAPMLPMDLFRRAMFAPAS
jgi:hypothetical protein